MDEVWTMDYFNARERKVMVLKNQNGLRILGKSKINHTLRLRLLDTPRKILQVFFIFSLPFVLKYGIIEYVKTFKG